MADMPNTGWASHGLPLRCHAFETDEIPGGRACV